MANTIEEIKEKVIDIVKNEVDIDLSKIEVDRELKGQVDIDSLQYTEIYAAVVEELNIEVPLALMSATTFREILDILHTELAKKPYYREEH